MPFLSRFGAQPAVSDDAEIHYASAARRLLEMVESESPAGEVVAEALTFLVFTLQAPPVLICH